MSTPLRFLLGLAVAGALAACGEDEPAAPGPEVPSTPAAALAWIREAEAQGDPDELDRRLARYPTEQDAFREATETQVVLTWRIQRALGSGRVEEAHASMDALGARFDGTGRTPSGRELASLVLRAGIHDAQLDAAVARIEGPHPDLEGARRALRLGGGYAADEDGEARARRVETWVEQPRFYKLYAHTEAKGQRPDVTVLVDDFALGEVILPQVLGRWHRDLGPMGLRVTVVPILTGEVRIGLRRLPAQDEAAELDSIRNRLIAYGVRVARPATPQLLEVLGIQPGHSALFVSNRMGEIVARMTGPTIDPRTLETVVQRLASR